MSEKQKSEDIINQKFGKLTVVNLLNFDKFHNRKVFCICDCGNSKIAVLAKLKSGDTKSCGCLRRENALKQIDGASEKNPKLKGKSDPRIATAKVVFYRYSDGNLTFEQFLELSQNNCFYCNKKPSNTSNHYLTKNSRYSKERQENGYFTYNGLDRLDNTRGHDFDNIVTCCITCNKAKLDRSKKDFLEWIKLVYMLHCV